MCEDFDLTLHKNSVFEQFTFFDAFAKFRKASMIFVMPVCPSARNYSSPKKISQNFIFEYFSKICPENSSFIKLWEEQRVRNTYERSWYLAEFVLE